MLLKFSLAFLKHSSLWAYRVATFTVLIGGFGFVALVIGLRYLVLPNINEYREPIARAVGEAAGQRVSIGAISGSWQGYRPELRLNNVQVFDAQGDPVLVLERVETVLSWLSLLLAEVRFHSLEIHEPEIEVRRDSAGVLWVAGIAVGRKRDGGFADWLLAQRHMVVHDARLAWQDEARGVPELKLEKVNLQLDSDGENHRFGLTGSPPSEVASQIVVRGEFRGRTFRDLRAWRGRLYAESVYANLAQAQTWIPLPLDLARGLGSLRVWLDLTGTQVSAVTADVRLVNVRTRLAPDLPELVLANLQGRLDWKRHGERTEASAEALGFTTEDGLTLAPMRLAYSHTPSAGAPGRSELRLEKLDLAPMVELAEFLPLDALLRGRLARSSPSGMVEEAQFSWEGDWSPDRPYRARARFAGLTLRPDGAFPGFHRISGQFEATERGGTVSLGARDGHIEMPRVFSEPVVLDFLTVEADWKRHDGRTYVTLKNIAFTNAHLAGNVYGSYHTDPEDSRGTIDLAGSLVRADASQVWRYIPVIAPMAQAWLKRALLAGESRDVRLRLKGPLKDFPFENEKSGLFEVTAKATNVTLDYASGWPPFTGGVADIVFRGRRMEVRPQAGSILGVRLSNVQAFIPEIGKHDEHLLVKGVGDGPTAEFLRFVASSPISRHTGRLTDEMKADGDARLDLELDLPLRRFAESKISGRLTLRNNRVIAHPRLPQLEGFEANIAFTRQSVDVKDGRARWLGNPVSFEASNQKGGMVLNLAGTLDAASLRGVSQHAVLQFLQGQVEWRGNIRLRDRVATARFDSNLVGLGSTLPPPFAKAAGAALPLGVQLRELPDRQSVLAIELGKVASAQLLLDSSVPGGIRRGMVSLGGAASLPVAEGLWVNGNMDVLDVDVWRGVFGGGKGVAQQGGLAGANLQIGILDANRRRFHDLKVDATRQGGAWQAALSGREIVGQVWWAPEGDGRLVARLSKLVLPPPTTGLQAGSPGSFSEVRLPSVDLGAENFVFEGKDLGRLSVLADPETSGWHLRRLEIVNPDSHLNLNGRWVIGETSRTDVTMRLEVGDIGRFFSRIHWPEGVKGGSALLEGPVAWMGSPTRIDIPSLSGRLKLEAKNGRFRQIEPGVAKLLGILSLQALPRRVTLDFKDVFRKGFTFDRINANLSISSGVAHTEDFMMEGSSARVGMHGQVDLAAESQNLNVRVTPSLSEGIAIAGAIVNPAIGVAALLAQKALKDPFGQIASFDYTVTGTWADPVVARARKSPTESSSRR